MEKENENNYKGVEKGSANNVSITHATHYLFLLPYLPPFMFRMIIQLPVEILVFINFSHLICGSKACYIRPRDTLS